MLRRLSILLVALIVTVHLVAPVAAQQATPAALEGIDKFVDGIMAEWGVPGLGITVVKEGEVILARGYGYRNVEAQLPVTADTLFAIGSNSKSFTATILGTLVEEGKLDWDEPVQTYLPDFRLYDPIAGEAMTPRDLVTHRSGLPRHDLVWYGADWTRREMFERLRYLEPSHEFRAIWQYQNLMFMTAGYLAGQVAGTTWEELVRERLFMPLDMTRSNFSVERSQHDEDHALPYEKREEVTIAVPFRSIDEIGPAGSINSSVGEMIRYVQMHIDGGKAGDVQVLPESTSRQMQTPQMVMPGQIQYDELGHSSYGLGLMITTYQGKKLVIHGGGIDGFISQMSWLPRQKFGVVVLTNLGGNNPVPNIVTRYVYDRLLDLEPVDWSGRIKADQEKAEAAAEAKEEDNEKARTGTAYSHDLDEYAGTYEHPAYGKVRVDVADGNLNATFNGINAPLGHYHYDIFQVVDDPANPVGEVLFSFSYDKTGRIDRVAIALEPTVDDIVFTRVPDETMRD